MQDITSILTAYKGINPKLNVALETLKQHRTVLCAFHTKKLFGFGKTSSQLSECVHSQMKGGNSYSRWLRANSYVETIRHIVANMKLYVDETIARIQACVAEKKPVSDWVADKLHSSIGHVSRCLCPMPRLQGTDESGEKWLLFETTPAKGYLPGFQQKHDIHFPSPSSSSQLCTCKCPYYTSTRLPCPAMCAVFAQKSIASIEQMVPYLDTLWPVRYHPLFCVATSGVSHPHQTAAPGTALPASQMQRSAYAQPDSSATGGSVQNFNDAALRATSLPSDAAGRSSVLASLWSQVFTPSVQSVQHCRNLYELLVRHRASLTHSSNLVVAPPTTLTQSQLAAHAGPASAVVNLSAPHYNPAARRRVATAKAKDPSCYSVHKTAVVGQQVTCLCGVGHINDHKVRRLYSCLLLHVISFIQMI